MKIRDINKIVEKQNLGKSKNNSKYQLKDLLSHLTDTIERFEKLY